MITGVMKELGSAGLPSQLSFSTSRSFGFAGADVGRAAASPKPGNSVAIWLAKALRVKRFESICVFLRGILKLLPSVNSATDSRQCERENIMACRDGHILFAQDCVAHGRSLKSLAGGEVPQRLAGFRIHSLERFGIIAEENQTAGRGHYPGGRVALAGLRIAPFDRAGIEIVCHQRLLAFRSARAADAGGVIRTAFGKTFRLHEKCSAILECEEIEEMRVRIEGRRIPIRGAGKSGANQRAIDRGFDSGQHRTPLRVDGLGPIQLLDERNGGEKVSVAAIENVSKAIAVRLQQKFSRVALIIGVDDDRSFRGVVVEYIVRRKLKIPFELAGVGIE